MRMIGTTLPSNRLQQVDHHETGTEMWAALCELYEKRQNAAIRESTILRLSEELKGLKCSAGGDVQAHVNKMFSLKTELASYGYDVNNINMKSMLLESLPDQYEFEQLRGAVKYGGHGGTLTPEGLRVLIEEAADRQSRRRGNERSAGGRGKPGGRRPGGGSGNGASQHHGGGQGGGGREHGDSRHPETGGSNDRAEGRTCFRCGQPGHFKVNCPNRASQGGQRKNQSNFTHSGLRDQAATHNEPGIVASATEEAYNSGVDVHTQVDDGSEVSEVSIGSPSHAWWCFDTGSNAHIVGELDSFVHMEDIVPENIAADVYGVAHSMATQAKGIGTVKITSMVDGRPVDLFIDGVLYVPGARHGLFSMGFALEQGFEVDYDRGTRIYSVFKDNVEVIHAYPAQGIWMFDTRARTTQAKLPQDMPVVNYTAADGVGSLQVWHDRLGHTCAQYLKVMVDRGLVKGMMLSQRQERPCDACHIGKQKQKRRRRKLDRGVTAPNEIVYADLLFPGQGNGTTYKAVLVIMDGWSRFLTVHLLTSKESTLVNKLMQQYVVWAERQAGRGIKMIVQREFEPAASAKFPVQRVLTDKGGEFVNGAMESWYASRGIEHVKVGPKSSHLNPCERAHQSLMEMAKAQMHASGFPRSFWPYALQNAAYIKNRVYAKPIEGVPYERMFGVKPDVHHIRKFGSLAYVHVPISPDKQKQDANAYVAFVLGYAEDTVGCKVYIPSERTVKFVAEVRVQEEIMYRDRHDVDPADVEATEWLQFTTTPLEEDVTADPDNSEYDVADSIVAESDYSMSDTNDNAQSEINTSVSYEANENKSTTLSVSLEWGDDSDTNSVSEEHDEINESVSLQRERNLPAAHDPDTKSVSAECGSVAESVCSEIDDTASDNSDDATSDKNDDGVSDKNLATATEPKEPSRRQEQTSDQPAQIEGAAEETGSGNQHEIIILPPGLRKRVERDDTPSEVEQNALGKNTKARHTGLREAAQRKAPSRYRDYVPWSNMAIRVLGKDGKPIQASNIRIPRNRREAMRSKHANLWEIAELEEMAAMRSKGVLEEIDEADMPSGAKAIKTMWVYGAKTDQHGYIIRLKARLVALGNWQRPGIDFVETFATVARMSSFRLVIALAAKLNLAVYGGDINTAYLNASLEIPQYVRSVEGFPCKIEGNMYIVKKALYGLRQSGREWNTELNGWLVARGFQRCATEPCLYFKYEDGTVALVLVYVDDVLCATNNENFKSKLFEDLNAAYGLKDQGELSEYLGAEVKQSSDEIFISQRKYARDVLVKCGYESANKCGNPMETKARLMPSTEDDKCDSSFDYRGVLGMLMYLATCTRPDLAYSLGQLSRFVSKPTTRHVGALKRVLRYLVGTTEFGIRYQKPKDAVDQALILQGYCDSDWGSDPETRKSTSGFVFMLASGAIAWMSRRQPIIALSTAEAEYVAACEASMEASAESNILSEIAPTCKVHPIIGIDSSSAHVMATCPTYSRRTRHIELRWHYVREQVQRGSLKLIKVDGEENPADAFTKPLDKARLQKLCLLMGVMAIPNA